MTTVGERLHLLYELNRGLTTFTDLTGLLRYVTRRARDLFQAEGCALLLLDAARREFYFPVVSDSDQSSEARLTTLRFPADRGIAGWVLQHDQATMVADVSADPRFFAGIDQETAMTTRSLLCAPLRTRSGNIGVIEVVNPTPDSLTQDTLEFLETLAGDVAVACEKALLYESLRGQVDGLRQACRIAGFGLVAVGIIFALGALFGHLAYALPLSELPTRPGMWMAAVGIAVGVALLAVARGWLVDRRPLTSG